MPTSVTIDGVGEVQFPDTMSEADIASTIKSNLPQWTTPEPTFGQQVKQAAISTGKALVEPIRAIGQSVGYAGGLTGALAKDVMAGNVLPSTKRPGILPNLENVGAFMQRREQPADETLTPIQQGVATGVKMLPALALTTLGQAAGIPANISFPALSGAETFAETGSPVAALTSAGINAVVPGVQKAGMEAAAKVSSNLIKRFAERATGDVEEGVARMLANSRVAQKAIETAVGNATVQAYLSATQLPEFIQATPQKQQEMLAAAATQFIGFSLLQLPYFKGSTLSRTQQLIQEDVPFVLNHVKLQDPEVIDKLARAALDPRNAQVFQEARQNLPPTGGIENANIAGEKSPGDLGQHPGIDAQLQTVGQDRNIPPQEPASSESAISSDSLRQSGKVTPQEAQTVAPVLAPAPVTTIKLAPTLEQNLAAYGLTPQSSDAEITQAITGVVADAQKTLDAGGEIPPELAKELKVIEAPVVEPPPGNVEVIPPVPSEMIPDAKSYPEGVVRVTYRTPDGKEIGYGHLDGKVINAVTVNESYRRQGFGLAILSDLRKRGGLYGVAGTPEGLALMRSSGAREYEPNKFTFEPEPPKQAPTSAPAQRSVQEMPFDIITAIKQLYGAGKLSLSSAQQFEKGFKPAGSLLRGMFVREGGNNLDDVLSALHGTGQFRNITTETELLDALKGAPGQRQAFRSGGARERKLMRREESDLKDFTDIAIKNKRAKGKQADSVAVDDLLTGDAFKVDGEDFVVKELVFNPETQELDHIIAQDGKRFGVKTIAGQQTLYADKGSIVQHEPSTEFLDPQEQAQLEQMLGMPVKAVPAPGPLPKLRRGEKQGDVFANQTEDLALVGEKGKDYERLQKEASDAAKRKAEADAANIAAHKDLFGPLNAANIWRDNILDSLAQWQNKGTPQQLLAHLARTRGAMDEAAWIGLDEFLKGKASVTKDEVEAFVKANKVEVKEVELGGPTPWQWVQSSPVLWEIKLPAGGTRSDASVIQTGQNEFTAQVTDTRQDFAFPVRYTKEHFPSLELAKQYVVNRFNDLEKTQPGYYGTKFQGYQTSGGSDYRELLLTLPEPLTAEQINPDAQAIAQYKQSWDALSQVVNDAASRYDATQSPTAREQLDQAEAGLDRLHQMMVRDTALRMPRIQRQAPVRGSHFDQNNILAHVRFNTRTDSEGKKVLFIEEIQSDWNAAGRKEGFQTPQLPKQGYDVKADGLHTFGLYDPETKDFVIGGFPTRLAAELYKSGTRTGVPAGPFVTKTEGYVGLVIRRMIRYAAENGFDSIAWTTGEMQNDRYDLSKQIDSIKWQKLTDGNYSLDVYKDGRVLDAGIPDSIAPDDIESYVGKGVAEQILGASKGEQKISKTPLSDDEQRRLEYLRYEKEKGSVWGPARRDELSKLEAKEQGGIAKTSKETSGLITGANLRAGGTGMKSFYDRIIPNEVNKFVKKWGGRAGTTTVDAGNAPVFSGQNLDLQSVKDRIAYIRSIWEQPGRTAEGWQRWNTALDAQATQVLDAMQNGSSYIEAMQAYGSAALANEIGGKFESRKAGLQVHSIELTPAMKQAAMEGMPLFGPTVPTSNVPTLVDSQGLIDRALSIGGGEAALKALVPNVRIEYGSLAPGRPAQYFGGVITLQKSVLDFIATRWPERAQQEIQKIIAEELTHAIADTALSKEIYLGIEAEMSEQDRKDILSERPELAQQPYQIGAEYFAKRILSENEQSRPIDPNSTFGQRILSALQKIWDYLTAALKRFQGRNTVIEQALKQVRQAKADVLAGKTPTFEQGEALNAKAIKEAMALYREKPTPESERALRMAQAGEVVLARPVAQEALKQLRSQAGISKEEIAANPEQAAALRTKRDVAKRVLSTPFVKRNFAMPSEHHQAALNALNGDLETFGKIRNDPNATPEEVGTAAGNAFETLQMFEATKTSLLNAIAKRRPAIVRELAKTFDAEAEALENRDVYQVLTQDFKDMGRLLMRMQKDQAVLSAYKQATSNTAATKNVLKFIHDNMDFSGMTTDDLRSIDDLYNRVRSTIIEKSGKFPKWNGTNVPEVVGASEEAIRAVLRIVSLSEPFRTDLENSKQVVDAKQFSAPLDKIKADLATKLKAGQYEGALGLYEKGLVASGINLKQSRDAAAFYLKNTRRLLVNLQAMDTVKDIAEQVGSDPELIRQANEVYKFHNIARITHGTPTEGIDKGKSTAITFKRANPADEPITISFGNTIQDQNKVMENARTLASEYQAYIANPDAPGYDPRLAAGMEKDLDLLGRFLDPDRNPKIRGRLVPSLPVRAWDFFSSKLGHFAIIPKYITSGTTGHLADVVDLTRTALSTIGEKGGIILRQHELRLNNSLDAALKAHGNMNEGEYHLMVLNPLAASRQNFNNPGMLKPGDAIGNGEVVTPADMAYLRAVRAFEGDLFKMIESSGHEFKSVKSMFAGILFDKNGQVRSPITHGPDMTGRDFPSEMQTWVDDWSKAATPDSKVAFLNHWKDPLLIGFVRGAREVDWKFSYSYPLEMRAIARELSEPNSEPLVNFDDLVTRIFDHQIVEDGVEPKDMDEIADDILSDFDRIFNKLKPIVAQGGDNPKTELEVIGGSNSFNTPRSVTVMPPGWYNYGVVTAGERAGTLRAAGLSFQLAHVKAVEALRDSLARVVNDFASKQTKEGISEYQLRRQSAKQMAAGDILYDFGMAERELQNVDNWLQQLKVMMARSANPYVKDSVHMAAMRGGAQLVITSIVSGPAAVTKNIAGGYQNLAMLDMLLRRQNFVTALASRGGELTSQVLKELTYLATHEGNPATAGLRKLLEKSENVAFIGDVAKLILGYANQQREAYNYATQAGVNYNIDLWDNIKSKWKFSSTLGHPRANDPMWHEAWANRASLAGNSLAQAIGQGSVGYADVRLNTRMLAAALPIEEHFRQIAITWGNKMEASGLFPDKALGQGWWGNDLSAARIRDFFRSSGVGPIDAIMADFYKRWTDDKTKEKAEGLPPGSLSSKTSFFTDGQMHQLEQALTEDNNATYANRPTFFKQSQAHSKFAPLWGYPTWFIRKLLELTNGLSNKPWYKNLVSNMPMLIQVAIGIAAIATLGYGAASFLKRFFENKVTGFPTVFDAQNQKQAAQAILAATADSIPFIGTALNSVTGAGYRTGFDINSQFLALNFAGDVMRTYKEIAQSGDIGGPLQRFVGRYFFPLNVIGAHAPNLTGLRELTNAKNILVMGARGTGLETKLRRTGGSGSDAVYSASTPIINEAMNALGKGDTAGFQSAYAKLVDQKRAAGSLNPTASALTALRGRNPLTSVFGTKPTQQELDQVYANLSPALATRARDTLSRFDTAIASLPRTGRTASTRTTGRSRLRTSSGVGFRLRRPKLRLRMARLSPPRLRRLAA